jgi:hypothetical protein
MDYGLTCDVLTCKHFLFLTEEEFEAARKARGHLFEVLDIEEKLNIVLENYIEYEHELLQITLKDAAILSLTVVFPRALRKTAEYPDWREDPG